jgi:hypothetical protein
MRQALTAAAVLAATAVLGVAPAAASTAWFDFKRNTNTSSVLRLYYETNPGFVTSIAWRAGSGSGTDECRVGVGWLPAGWYDLWGHWDHYDGAKIKGRVFWLQNKQCYNGTWRTELFIHSEETAANGQYCPTAGDDPFCWEGDFDYYSQGCIKVSHGDIGSVHTAWHNGSKDYSHGQSKTGWGLYVHN